MIRLPRLSESNRPFLSCREKIAIAVAALLIFTLFSPCGTRVNAGAVPNRSSALVDWRVTGPMGGDVRALVIDPKDARKIYLGTLDGQIYVSTDGGERWSRLASFNRPGLYIDHIIIDPRDSRILYVGAHRHKEPGGFFKSTDGGQTWREAKELKGEAIHSLAQSSTKPDVIVAGTNNGVYRSDDAGETWTKLPTTGMTNTNIESLAIDPRNDKVIYAGSWHLPFKTTDGGQTWRKINKGMIDDSDIFAISIDNRNPDHIIASACSGIYESKDAGETWHKVQGIPSSSRRTRDILQHPSRPEIVYAGTTEGFWRSTKGGADGSWTLMTSKQLEVNAIAVHPDNPDTVYIGTNNYGVMVSHDGGRTFAMSNEGFSGRLIYTVVADRERPGRVYASTINTTTGGGFFFISDDGGMTWQPAMRNMPRQLIAYSILQDRRDPNVIYLGTNFGLYKSLDRGMSWSAVRVAKPRARASRAAASATDDTVRRAQEALKEAGYDVGAPDGRLGPRTSAAIRKFQIDKNLPPTGRLDERTLAALGIQEMVDLTEETINSLTFTPDERDGHPGMLAATNSGLYRTYDPARGWERISYGSGFDARTLAVSVDPQNPETIWVGTATSGLLVSHDGGRTWQQIKAIPTIAPVNTIVQDPKRAGYIYVGTGHTLYLSRDGGQSWMRRGGNLPIGNFTSILINPNDPDEIFAGSAFETGGGIFRSTDAGMTWERIDPELPSRRVWSLAFDRQSAERLLIGSHSGGVYVALRSGVATASSGQR
ncbi:VPS10 domain-containing protein [Pyrinomonas methylaliphatogenes]|uniref:Putative peptidoglycan binding protein,BNR/Asp-box repeat protein n=1 Tax=Pyrinomonas methylaliphatogenes TaxID=454194 RepID=A0A0B6WWH3_9BACT|nr:YCF48-related protein [Pyrinomonas methylaliphatogenes]CDM65461.1 putative peptidoglycan binding protein,BNR/Asp-box repeat protein [Pyrinomonas methylaliphatogenes]